MSGPVSRVGFYYINGSGSKSTGYFQKIIQESPNFEPTIVFVSFQPNDASPIERLVANVAALVVGVGATLRSANKECKKRGNLASRAIGILGFGLNGGALYDYHNMQGHKNKVATLGVMMNNPKNPCAQATDYQQLI